jgi:4-amino-4-deoxychorismate lyase
MASATVWVNGVPGGAPDPADRGLAYGDGLFETVRVVNGRPVLAERHWQRLNAGCRRLGIPLDLPFLRTELAQFLLGRADGVLKVVVTRGPGGRGYLPPLQAQPTRVLSWHSLPAYPLTHAQDGIAAGICRQPVGESPLLAGLKHLNRLEQVLLRAELEPMGCAEALVVTAAGEVVEGVFSNVFMVRGGSLLTPLLDRAGVQGVMRAELMGQAQALGLPVQETRLTVGDFLRADEAFFCNSIYGIWPVRELAGSSLGTPGNLTRQLQAAIAPLLR